MVVVTVDRQAVRTEKVVAASVVVFVLRTDVIVANCRPQAVHIRDLSFIGIRAVAWVTDDIGTIQSEHQSCTSFAPSSRTLVMNLSAVMIVSSSQSPPRVTSKPSSP